MIVGIDCLDIVGKRPQPFGAEIEIQVVFLAQIPLQRQMMAKAGNDFAIVKLALGAKLAIVELLLVLRFGFVEDKVQKESLLLGMA